VNFFPFHIGDYAVHTRHLTLMEDLAYRRLLDLYYTREGSLPPDTQIIARLLGMKEQHAEVESVLCEFFLQNEDGWEHARCDAEIAKMHAKQENARASVAKRASVTQAPRERDASVIEASTTNTNTNTNKEKEKRPRKARATPLPDGFGVSARVNLWAIEKGYTGHLDADLEAFVSYVKRSGKQYVDWDEALMTAIREDWAKARGKPQDIARTTVAAAPESFNRTREAPMTPEQREAANAARKLAMSALKVVT
jgi:uncharacterized protein YdaU (DUF1376 family)